MAVELLPRASTPGNFTAKGDAGWSGSDEQISRPYSDVQRSLIGDNGIACVALRRGEEVMALFCGCPKPSALLRMQELKIAMGIALSPDELHAIRKLDQYSYVFVAERSQAAVTLKLALADLARLGWAVVDIPTWVAVSVGPLNFGRR